MSQNKRNVDTDRLSNPSTGTPSPSGTGTHEVHRVAADKAEPDNQIKGAAGRKAGEDKDPRAPEIWQVGPAAGSGEPMTADQAERLRILSAEAGEPFEGPLTRAEADRRIDELQRRAGLKP